MLDLPALDRRCARDIAAPLIVAYSGGGNSLALLLAARDWAAGAGRRLIAVTVDHRLQAAGAEWARTCAARCRSLGVAHAVLTWTGDKPAAGLPAAARAARHGLIADFARDSGAAVVLMGHTADDLAEARRMREDGSTVPRPREWSPSPVWPQGRDVFILRPLLERRRDDLRTWLLSRGETWIDDPANDDPRFARARARAALLPSPSRGGVGGGGATPAFPVGAPSYLSEINDNCAGAPIPGPSPRGGRESLDAGQLTFPRDAFDDDGGHRRLSIALLSASGGVRPPRGERVRALLERPRRDAPLTATLAGARVEAGDEAIVISREAGELKRRAPPPRALAMGVRTVWDGRFEIEALAPGLSIQPLAGLAARLEKRQRAALKAVPASLRGALPAIVDLSGRVTCPILAGEARVTVIALPAARFAAACGAIENEAAFWRVAKSPWAS